MTDDNADTREPVELLVPPVEQGSTFIPPADEEAVQRDASELFDDDDLATAMAEQFARATAGPRAAVSTATAVTTVVDSTGAITVVSDATSAEPAPVVLGAEPTPEPSFDREPEPTPESTPAPELESPSVEPEAVVVPPPLVEPPLSQYAPIPSLRPFEHTPRALDTVAESSATHEAAEQTGPTDESVVGARLGFAALFDPPLDAVDSDDTAEVATQANPTWEPSRTPTMNFDAVVAGGSNAPPPSAGPSPTWVEGSIVVGGAGQQPAHVVPADVEPVTAPAATGNEPTRAVAAHPVEAERAQTLEDLFGFDPDTVPVTATPSARDIHQFPADLAPAIQAPIIATTPPPAFRPEAANAEATPLDRRVGRSTRMFWLWFAANSSLVSVLLGGAIFSLGMSLRQSLVAVMAGIAVSFLPLGLGTLSGKRSGQPTLIASRAAFGVVGNGLPAFFGLASRLFWGAALLWLLGIGTASILTSAGYTAGFSETQLTLLTMGIAFVIALLVAFFGYGLLAPLQLVLSIVTGVLVVGFIALTLGSIDIATALTVPDGEWILVVTGAVLVFSFVGLAWANATADLARYQRPSSVSGGSSFWATFGVVLPSFVLIAHGALLAASDPGVATGFRTAPMDTLGALLPAWYPIPLLAATGLSLLSGVIVSLYSGGFALRALGFGMPRPLASVIAAALLAALAAVLLFSVTDFDALVRDFATTLAVPIAAWVGIFIVDTMIRHRQLGAASLVRRGGIYADVRWVNTVMFVVASVVGLGLTTAAVDWLGWEGYLFAAIDVPLDGPLAASDIGVLVALVLGMLTPAIAGIPGIRRQESTAPRAE
jgi:purine-cytosine permease-like protein